MRKYTYALAAGLIVAAGCKDNPLVPPVDSPTTSAVSGQLTSAGVKTLAIGVLANDRALASELSYSKLPEIYARDMFRIDPNEPRYVTETLGGSADPGGFSGSGGWTNGFVTIRAASTLLAALPNTPESQVSVAKRQTTTGLIETMKALEYYRLLELRDTLGVALQPDDDPNTVGPIICKTSALSYIAALLDTAKTTLDSAGSAALPFTPPSGFTAFGRDYSKAVNLVIFNRALKGKVDVYRGLDHQAPAAGAFAQAITELNTALGTATPGGVPASQFAKGVYVTFVAGGTENSANPLDDSRIGVNPRALSSLQAGDTRASKIIPRAALSGAGLTTSLTYVGADAGNSANLTNPMAIIRDEELVLLRAQAYFENLQPVQALADLNSVRTNYGLAALTLVDVPTLPAQRAAVVYEKRYSLFFEGPQHLVDLRAYGMLTSANTPAELPADPFNTAIPIPKTEADARGGRDKLTPTCS
jgi:starch-binding outer membrane protein, SusD/RagB family